MPLSGRYYFPLSLNVTPSSLLPDAWLKLFDAFQQVGRPEPYWKFTGSKARLPRQ